MSRRCLSVSFAAALLATGALAQAPEIPAPSPKAKVDQRVGLTDFSVEYSSPGVKGRKIWGGLVPLNEMWRTGANASTKLTASKDFTFGDKAVLAGTYTLLTIPGASSWTVILNKNLGVQGTNGYDPKDDVARVDVPSSAAGPRERMTFLFSDTTDEATRLDLEWENLRVSVPIKVDTKAQVRAGIDKSLADAWRPHFASGRYLYDTGGDLDTALQYLDTSISIKPTWNANWFKAQVLAKKGRQADAIASAQKALDLGKGDEGFQNNFKADVEKAVADWKKAKS
ncbi:MAG TPA: DUF2911 domain-containing protein [Candidatus Polarisedimenticolaceae bacterium]|nr:DUF2911 domain-containing protein [Candidatus Polarisedimenticolaceae bacterium]